jgi:DNA-binding IclR family transcriptional regulator
MVVRRDAMAQAAPVGPIGASDLVRSVQRALRVLEIVAERPDGLTAKAVARRAGIALSTAYHLLNTLVAEGYVVRLDGVRGFGLGYRVSALSRSLRDKLGVTWAVDAAVTELHQRAGAAAYYAVFRGADLVVAHVVDSPDTPRADPAEVGFADAAHALAAGKLMLAALPPEQRRQRLQQRGLPAFTRLTITDPARLERELVRVAASGMAAAVGEFLPGVACLAARVTAPDGSPADACVSVSLPAAEFDARRAELEPLVRQAAARTGRALAAAAERRGSPGLR